MIVQDGDCGRAAIAAGAVTMVDVARLSREPGLVSHIVVGPHHIETRRFDLAGRLSVRASATSVIVILPAAGRIAVRAESCCDTLLPGSAALVARAGTVEIDGAQAASTVILHLARSRIQVCASRLKSAPMRVSATNRIFRIAPQGCAEEASLVALLRGMDRIGLAAGTALEDGEARLVGALIDMAGDEMFVRSRSISAAQHYLAMHQGDPVSLQRLAGIAGVAERTLREAFRDVLGLSLPAYVQEFRLEWARKRLASRMDGRPIEAFAQVTGYRSAAAFARAYKQMFGETPTVTRAIAVRGDRAIG